ncbi:MAG: TonB-dependent receptor [bacterium]|nr:TonB-dependent receptor [bacterium]
MGDKTVKHLAGLIVLAFLFSFVVNTPLLAQEKEEEVEDVMDMALEDLLNVEITTAGKQAEKINEIPASVVVVTRADIEKYGYQDLTEVLENIPGLYYVDDYWFGKKFGVRGFWSVVPQRNLAILVNNVPQLEFSWGSRPFTNINVAVEAIDRIEVVRGPMSVIYGSGAFFGAINIITNQTSEKESVSMVSASFGAESTSKLFVRAAGQTGDITYSFNGAYSTTDGYDFDYSKFNPGLTGTTEGHLDDTRKFFNFSGTFKEFYVDMSYSETQKDIIFLLNSTTDGSVYNSQVVRAAFGYKKKFSEKATLDLRYVHMQNKTWSTYDWIPGAYAVEDWGSNAYKLEANLFLYPSEKFNLTLGVEYHKVLDVYDWYDVPAFGLANIQLVMDEGDSIDTKSIFAQFNYKFSDKLKFTGGARVETVGKYNTTKTLGGGYAETVITGTYDYTKAVFIPRAALIFSPNDKNIFKLLYGKAINRPSFFMAVETIFTLEPEEIQTIELNYLGQLSNKFTVNLSIFRNMLDQLIYRSIVLINGNYSTSHQNVGEMTTNGVELTFNVKPSDKFHMELSGTYQDTTNENNKDIDVGYAPKFLGYLKASYFFNKNVSLAVTGNYVGEMKSYYDETLTPAARLGDGMVDGYFVLGANLRFRNLFNKGFFLNIRGSNILDEEIYYPTTSNNNLFVITGTLGRGLSFLVTLGWKF